MVRRFTLRYFVVAFNIRQGTEHGVLVSLDARNLSAPTATVQVQGDLPVRAMAVNPNDPEQVAASGDNSSVDVYSKTLEKMCDLPI